MPNTQKQPEASVPPTEAAEIAHTLVDQYRLKTAADIDAIAAAAKKILGIAEPKAAMPEGLVSQSLLAMAGVPAGSEAIVLVERQAAALDAESLMPPEIVEALCQRFETGTDVERMLCAPALAASQNELALRHLVSKAIYNDSWLERACLGVLANTDIRNERILGELLEGLRSAKSSKDRNSYAEILQDSRDPRVTEEFLNGLHHEDVSYRRICMHALARREDPEIASALAGFIGQQAPFPIPLPFPPFVGVAKVSVLGMHEGAAAFSSLEDPAIKASLLEELRSVRDLERRISHILALSKSKDPEVREALHDIAISEKEELEVRALAARGCPELLTARDWQFFSDRLKSDEPSVAQHACAKALRGCSDPEIVEVLARMVDQCSVQGSAAFDDHALSRAVSSLAGRNDPKIQEALARIVGREDWPFSSWAAADALRECKDLCPEARKALLYDLEYAYNMIFENYLCIFGRHADDSAARTIVQKMVKQDSLHLATITAAAFSFPESRLALAKALATA